VPNVLAVDPGSTESAYVLIDSDCHPLAFDKCANYELLDLLPTLTVQAHPVIELIGHYGTGMPAGRTVFDTCIWIGRYVQVLAPTLVTLILRPTVKAHLCGSARANDGNVRQALVDRFAAGTGNHGKGSKAAPGFFYGFRADVWAAYAVAVTHADTLSHLLSSSSTPAWVSAMLAAESPAM
jgi:hypothetical protein